MKNKILVSLFSIFLSLAVFAQQKNICSYAGIAWSPAQKMQRMTDDPVNAEQIIQEIIDVVGLTPNFEIKAARVPNAAAVIYGGKRYILYNPDFFTNLIRTTGNKWAAVSVLAHEIGHHLDGHTLNQIGSKPETELEADEFSGFVLRKMGASLSDAQIAMKTAGNERANGTHPGQYDRLTAIADGWNKADAQATGRTYVAKSKPAPQQPQVTTRASTAASIPASSSVASAGRYIIGDVRFNADANAAYYVTEKYNLVRVTGNGVSVVGKLATLNSSRFPYVIYDGDNNQLLVDAYGKIITQQGRPVGTLSARRG
jgi:hypothetical protein